MESGSKTSLASTYDNVEAICKRILIFLSNTFDNINIFQGDKANNRRNTDLVHQHVRISSLRQSLYPVYDAIRWYCLRR